LGWIKQAFEEFLSGRWVVNLREQWVTRKRFYMMGAIYDDGPQEHVIGVQANSSGNLITVLATDEAHQTMFSTAAGDDPMPALGSRGCIVHSIIYEEKTAATPTVFCEDAAGTVYSGDVTVSASQRTGILMESNPGNESGGGPFAVAPGTLLNLDGGAAGDEWHMHMEFW